MSEEGTDIIIRLAESEARYLERAREASKRFEDEMRGKATRRDPFGQSHAGQHSTCRHSHNQRKR